MTKNHSEATGPIDPNNAARATGSFDAPVVTLRSPAELADALPYLLGFKPEESIVLIAMHGEHGRFGGRVRLGVPERAEDWPCVAEQLAQCLVVGCERRGARPDGVVAFLCQEPVGAESGRQVRERLRPLAQELRMACGRLDVPVIEVVCISEGSLWTFCCPDTRCCPPEGMPLLRPGTSVLAAAATYMGIPAGVTQSTLRGRLAPWQTAASADQERALDAAALTLIPRMLMDMDLNDASPCDDNKGGAGTDSGRDAKEQGAGHHGLVAAETLDLARRIMTRLAAEPPLTDALEADCRDDELIAHDEAAALIFGLQDRTTRDRAAEWMEGAAARPALRLWRSLSRRCVGAYAEHAAAPLSLAGWVAWSLGDVAEGQEALDMALRADPGYAFALLLNQACNEDLDPEAIRRCLRRERDNRESDEEGEVRGGVGEGEVEGATEGQKATAGQGDAETEGGGEGQGASSCADEAPVDTPPRRRRRRLPRPTGSGDAHRPRTPGGSRAPSGPAFGGARAVGASGTGPRNRRRTLRRNTRDDR